jgi:hypothetical protein
VTLVSVSYVFKAFINKGGLAIVKSFKAAEAGVADNIKRVNRHNFK